MPGSVAETPLYPGLRGWQLYAVAVVECLVGEVATGSLSGGCIMHAVAATC
jgi:hypothetical protein